MTYLVDANVLSDPTKPAPNSKVLDWLSANERNLVVDSIILGELGIGILRVEKGDLEKLTFTLTVAEDLDCSGLPACGEQICTYDEGFISGLLSAHTGKRFLVKEVDCWGSGARVS
jgi:predicted hydrocarbon binding protein